MVSQSCCCSHFNKYQNIESLISKLLRLDLDKIFILSIISGGRGDNVDSDGHGSLIKNI